MSILSALAESKRISKSTKRVDVNKLKSKVGKWDLNSWKNISMKPSEILYDNQNIYLKILLEKKSIESNKHKEIFFCSLSHLSFKLTINLIEIKTSGTISRLTCCISNSFVVRIHSQWNQKSSSNARLFFFQVLYRCFKRCLWEQSTKKFSVCPRIVLRHGKPPQRYLKG